MVPKTDAARNRLTSPLKSQLWKLFAPVSFKSQREKNRNEKSVGKCLISRRAMSWISDKSYYRNTCSVQILLKFWDKTHYIDVKINKYLCEIFFAISVNLCRHQAKGHHVGQAQKVPAADLPPAKEKSPGCDTSPPPYHSHLSSRNPADLLFSSLQRCDSQEVNGAKLFRLIKPLSSLHRKFIHTLYYNGNQRGMFVEVLYFREMWLHFYLMSRKIRSQVKLNIKFLLI